MSLWARVQYLSDNSKQLIFKQYFESNIPIEVREYMTTWIENNLLNGNNLYLIPGNSEHDSYIVQIATAFIQEIRRVAEKLPFAPNLLKQNLQNAYQQFSYRNPAEIYSKLTDCLKNELRLLQMEEKFTVKPVNGIGGNENNGEQNNHLPGYGQDQTSSVSADFTRQVCTIVNKKDEWITTIDSMQDSQQRLIHLNQQRETAQGRQTLYASQNQQVTSENPFQKKASKLDSMIQDEIREFQNRESRCIEFAENMVTEVEGVVRRLIQDFLGHFKWSEYSVVGKSNLISLSKLQGWFTDLLCTVSQVIQTLQERERDAEVSVTQFADCNLQKSTRQRIKKLTDRLEKLCVWMMNNSLVVDEQPPQVIKKDSKVIKNNEGMSVRFLCGDRFLTMASSPIIKAIVINERQALELYNTNGVPSQSIYQGCGRVINNTGAKICDPRTSLLTYQFRNLSVSTVRRIHKKNEKRAMTEKFCFLFCTEFMLNGQSIKTWCCSVPFVFIVHVCQKPEAWATIFWDNAFRQPNRNPFAVPEEVEWSQMPEALNNFFKQHTETTWNLTATNIKYLGEKIFGSKSYNDSSLVSFKVFSGKENSPKPGFWEWFYATMELTQKHLVEHWNKGYIIGFINRCGVAEDIVSRMNPGTFLVRFSDGTLGGLSITYMYSKCTVDGVGNHVESLNPFTDSDLKVKSLAGRLNDVPKYCSVYHYNEANQGCNTPKAIAFQPTIKRSSITNGIIGQMTSVRKPYVSSEVIMVIADSSTHPNLEQNYYVQNGQNNHYEQIGHHGQNVQNGHHGQNVQNGHHGQNVQNGHHGQNVQNGHHGQNVQNGHHGQNVQNGHNGQNSHHSQNGQYWQHSHQGQNGYNLQSMQNGTDQRGSLSSAVSSPEVSTSESPLNFLSTSPALSLPPATWGSPPSCQHQLSQQFQQQQPSNSSFFEQQAIRKTSIESHPSPSQQVPESPAEVDIEIDTDTDSFWTEEDREIVEFIIANELSGNLDDMMSGSMDISSTTEGDTLGNYVDLQDYTRL